MSQDREIDRATRENANSCILVTGPARSGKSEWAEAIAAERQRAGQQVIYVATALRNPDDPEWQTRIQQHQQRRPPNWRTVEVPVALAAIIQESTAEQCLLVDSLGTWLTNVLDQDEATWSGTLDSLIQSLQQTAADVILVAEEVGWGVVPSYPMGRRFRDRLGTLTRAVGAIAAAAYLVTAGHSLNLSQLGTPLSKALNMQPAYKADLAYIHDAGFGHLAENAAPVVLQALRDAGIHAGTIVDLGCGSGLTARIFHDAGFDVLGIDVSSSLIAIARQRVPSGEFRVGSFVAADIPPCVAVTAIGEVFNYGFDAANNTAARSQLFERIYAALAPSGLLVFDVASPARAPDGPQKTFVETPDWAVLVDIEADEAKQSLTRRITTFRKDGEIYRRDQEVHQLHLLDTAEVTATLQQIGFRVRTLSSYGAQSLPQGLAGVLAQK